MKEKELKKGEYQIGFQTKGKHEACIKGIKENDEFYTVRLEDVTYFDVKTQFEAEMLSRLVRIEVMLKR